MTEEKYKTDWRLVVLLAILIFAFYIRTYQIDSGNYFYHDQKTEHYSGEARNFERNGFFKEGIFVPVWDYPDIKSDSSGKHSDTFPVISIIVGIAFKIFGESLKLARAINIMFFLGSIFALYLIMKKLFNEKMALIAAAVMAILPVGVFFGRQVQLINPALFFCLVGTYYYLKWLDEPNWFHTIIFSSSLILGVMTKYSFALFAVPLLFLFPFKDLKEHLKKIGFMALLCGIAGSWIIYISKVASGIGGEVTTIDPSLLFTSQFWMIIWAFLTENYSFLGLFLMILGSIMFLCVHNKGNGYKYVKGYLIGSMVWFVVMAEKLQGHSYHQYPIFPLVVIFITLSISVISGSVAKMFKSKPGVCKYVGYSLAFLMILLLYTQTVPMTNRIFDTQFYGLDVAGEYIKANKLPGETLIHSSHQAYGILWHADIKGTKIPPDVERIKFIEEERNSTWFFVYQWDFKIFQDERGQYLYDNYHLEQAGIYNKQLVYLLFKKGGNTSNEMIEQQINSGIPNKKIYEKTTGNEEMIYINIKWN